MIGLVLDGAPGLIPSLRPLSASAGVLIHDDAAAAWAMGLLNQVAPLNALKQQDVSWTRCIITMGLPTAVPCLKDGLNAETGGITGLQELAAQAAGMGIIPHIQRLCRSIPSNGIKANGALPPATTSP